MGFFMGKNGVTWGKNRVEDIDLMKNWKIVMRLEQVADLDIQFY